MLKRGERKKASKLLIGASVGLAVLLIACEGEDRPAVEVIGGGSFTGSVSASGVAPSEGGSSVAGPAIANNTGAAGRYNTLGNFDIYFAMAADLRDMRTIMAPAATSQPVEWQKAADIFEKGKNQVNPTTAALRSLASLPNDNVYAVFPNGNAVYGRTDYINALARDALGGTGKAQGLSPAARAQLVEKSILFLFYGKALQEFTAAKTRVETNAANAGGPVDETWAILAGIPDNNGNRPHSLLATAASREEDFKLQGKISAPLEQALIKAQSAANANNLSEFNPAFDEAKGYINSIFYLSALRSAKQLESATTTDQRQTRLIEGWGSWQPIRAIVAGASASAAKTIEDSFSRPADQQWAAAQTTAVYNALNEPAVLSALGIPAPVQVKTAPAN